MPKVKRWLWQCNRCGHEFRGNTRTAGRKPKKCPRCNSPYWDSKRVRVVVPSRAIPRVEVAVVVPDDGTVVDTGD